MGVIVFPIRNGEGNIIYSKVEKIVTLVYDVPSKERQVISLALFTIL